MPNKRKLGEWAALPGPRDGDPWRVPLLDGPGQPCTHVSE